MSSSFMYATASVGADAHLFVKSNNRRIHSSENVRLIVRDFLTSLWLIDFYFNLQGFVVRNSGHSAGFDETDKLRIY